MKKFGRIVFFVVFLLGFIILFPQKNTFAAQSSGQCNYEEASVTIKWQAVESVAKYCVQCNGEALFETTESFAKIEGLSYGQKYQIEVQALGAEDESLGIISFSELYLPEKIETIKTTAISKKKVSVYWNEVKGANAYELYYKAENSKKYKLYKETKSTRESISIKEKLKYVFRVVPKFVNDGWKVKGTAVNIDFDNNEIVAFDKQKYTYKDMVEDIKALAAKYSEYVSYSSIGKSEKGNKIYDVVLGNPKAKKSLLVVCELHAREYVTTHVNMKALEYYLINYNNKLDGKLTADTFNECNVHYIMMANPDGVSIAQNKNERWKGNANGVNLNRNFPYKHISKGKNNKGIDWTGKKAASEKETKAIMKITKKLKKQGKLAVISYHAMGSIVFGSYHGKNKSVKKMIKKMYDTARNTTGYADAGRADYGTSNGAYREYCIYSQKIPCITIEMGITPCPVELKYYSGIYDKNKLVILREARLL